MPSDSTETKPTIPPGTGHEKHAFLVGEQVYLRTITEDDAKFATAWRGSVFPKNVDGTEKWIEDELKDERTLWLLIVRKSDDRIVGSVQLNSWKQTTWVTPFADPVFGMDADGWLAEAAMLATHWTVDERQRVIVYIDLVPADRPVYWQGLEAGGARRCATFTEKIRRGSGYVDEYLYEYLNKQWVARLGDPADDVLERTGTGQPRPVISPVTIEGPLPKHAIRIGPRVYLRPPQKSDAAVIAEWARKETEAFWDNGRMVRTASSTEKWFDTMQETDPPSRILFAVCLRENDDCIGFVGFDQIDYVNRCAESESEFHRTDYRGAGYGSEAKHLLFDYAFNTLGLHSLQSWVMFANTRSAAALRKQGYREVGRQHWLVQQAGRFENFVLFELLADEWRTMPRA